LSNLERLGIQETPRRHPGSTQDAPGQSKRVSEESGGFLEALGASRELWEEKLFCLHVVRNELATSTKVCMIYTTILQCPMSFYQFLQGQISKVAILDESDEGTMRYLRSLRTTIVGHRLADAPRCLLEDILGTRKNRQNPYSRDCFGNHLRAASILPGLKMRASIVIWPFENVETLEFRNIRWP